MTPQVSEVLTATTFEEVSSPCQSHILLIGLCIALC